MPAPVALVASLLFIALLLWRDRKQGPAPSVATWIPTLWLLINGSRQASVWLGQNASFAAQRLEEGSSVDKAVYGLLMLAAATVLLARRTSLMQALRGNPAIFLWLGYAGISFMWSDFPLVALKRWFKALGDPLMVLVLWTDPHPERAITAVLNRCVYMLITLSVLFCKYYEYLGTSFDEWGRRFYTGVTTDKNMLGYVLFVSGLLLAVRLFGPRPKSLPADRLAQVLDVLVLSMTVWLFNIANSKTALLALLAGAGVVLASHFKVVRARFGTLAMITVVAGVMLELTFSITGSLAEGAGRDATFTGRTGLWQTLLQEPINPLVGVGYGSFWLGERLLRYWAMYPNSPPIEAHNGYIEMYINLGLVGLVLLIALLWSGLSTMRARMAALVDCTSVHAQFVSIFGIAYGTAYLLYNVTEATFQGLNFLFTIFLVFAFSHTPPLSRSSPYQKRLGVRLPRVRQGSRPLPEQPQQVTP
jgi:exopolysaccharide production protein ExoQ